MRTRRDLQRLILGAIATGLLGTSCGKASDATSNSSTSDPASLVARLIVNPSTVTLAQLTTTTLTVTATDAQGRLVADVVVTFQASDATMLTVSSVGVVTAVGPAGNTSVVVSAGSASTTVAVTVTQTAAGATITPSPVIIPQKGTAQLQVKVTDAVGAPMPLAELSFTPSNTAALSVSINALVTSTGTAGAFTIAIGIGGSSFKPTPLNVTVTPVAATLQMAVPSLSLIPNQQTQLSVTALDPFGVPLVAQPAMQWTSSNQAVVAVSSTGVITAVGPLGSSTVSALTGTLVATLPVTVAAPAHPSGNSVTAVPFTSAWGLTITTGGQVIATRVDGSSLGIASIQSRVFSTSIAGAGGLGAGVNSVGTIAYVPDQTNSLLHIVDLVGNRVTTSLEIFGDPLATMVSTDGQSLYVSDGDGFLYVMSLATNTITTRVRVGGANVITHHPTQPLLYLNGTDEGLVSEVNTNTNNVTRTFCCFSSTPQQPVVSANGNLLYVPQEGGDLSVFNLITGNSLPSITGGGGFGAALTADGTQLWVTSGSFVKVIDLAQGAIIKTIIVPATARRIAFSADGLTAVVTGDGGFVTFIQ